jgi:hypothetical protein
MIKRTILSMIAIAFTLCASAQVLVDDESNDDSESNEVFIPTVLKSYVLSVGPKVGINYSMAGDPDDLDLGIGGKMGFNAGLAVNFRFARPAGKPLGAELFGVEVEALYALHSLKTDEDNLNMSAFEIPVLFQWYAFPSLFIEVGPTFTGVFSTSPKELQYNSVSYQTEKIKGYDVMLTVGLGYKHKSGFMANLRYNMGNSDLAGNFQTKVSTVSVGIGWLFNVVK